MIRQILRKIRFIPIYSVLNLRRFLSENKIKKIENNELLKNGFTQFHSKNGEKIKNLLNDIINKPEKAEKSKLGIFKILYKNNFGVKTIVVDASSQFLHELVFIDEILDKLRNYYGKEFYLRNNPTIEFNYDDEVNDAQFFHLDYCAKQTSVMINLNKINVSSTHMEYIKKTNKYYRFTIPNREEPKEINNVNKISKKNDVVKTIGDVGDISIFDAGSGYHRQVGGGKRIMLHLNFTENLAHTGWKKNWKPKELDYWFSNKNINLENKLFKLVTKKLNKSFFTPNIYHQK